MPARRAVDKPPPAFAPCVTEGVCWAHGVDRGNRTRASGLAEAARRAGAAGGRRAGPRGGLVRRRYPVVVRRTPAVVGGIGGAGRGDGGLVALALACADGRDDGAGGAGLDRPAHRLAGHAAAARQCRRGDAGRAGGKLSPAPPRLGAHGAARAAHRGRASAMVAAPGAARRVAEEGGSLALARRLGEPACQIAAPAETTGARRLRSGARPLHGRHRRRRIRHGADDPHQAAMWRLRAMVVALARGRTPAPRHRGEGARAHER